MGWKVCGNKIGLWKILMTYAARNFAHLYVVSSRQRHLTAEM